MKIVPIFADRLYSFNYDSGDGPDEFYRLFEDWQSVEFLEQFFESNKNDLKNGFFDPIPTVEQAVLITREEAKRLESRLRRLAANPGGSLDAMFKPLSENEDYYPFPRHKTYGTANKSWLRIYSIKVEQCYCVTGGAIKLTKGMKEREHTMQELKKIDRCFSFFKEEGITDFAGVKELDL